MKKHIFSVLTLFLICAIVSVALAVVFGITDPIIKDREAKAALAALTEVLPGTTVDDFVEVTDERLSKLPASVTKAYEAEGYGCVIQVQFAGFYPDNIAMIGVSADGKITGTKCITVKDSGGNGKDSATEIPKMDEGNYYVGADASTIDGVDTIAGVTISTKAYRAAVKDALNAALILGGATVDLRTPEQILSDNLNAALGVSGAEFDTVVLTDDITGVDAVYVAKDDSGHVAVIGENFFGVNTEGNFVAAVDAKTNSITASDADKETAIAAVSALKSVTYEDIDLSTYPELPAGIKSAKKSSKGVYVIVIEFNGYAEGNSAEITVGADGKVIGTKILVINDTPTYGGAKVPELDANGHFNGATLDTIEGIDTIAGCTISTKAYRTAIKDALAAAAIFGGGDVDLRDPEQILSDNLNAALGVSGVEFDKYFFMEVVEGVDAIYVAKDGSGHVVVIGEAFYGFDADGNAIGEANDVAANAIATIKATTLTELDPRAYDGVSKRVKSALVTNSGVYVLEVEGPGFGKKGSSDYGASGEYIIIRIALTADGRIIDCYTVYQSESKGFGDVCGTEEFYGQFAGKNNENYEEIIIAGSTYTTDGYHKAIENAFKAVAIFEEGGAN